MDTETFDISYNWDIERKVTQSDTRIYSLAVAIIIPSLKEICL